MRLRHASTGGGNDREHKERYRCRESGQPRPLRFPADFAVCLLDVGVDARFKAIDERKVFG